MRQITPFVWLALNQRYAMRRDVLAKDVANRTLHDTSQQASLITMYSLVGRIRMISSDAVLIAAEKVAEDIVESYKRPPTTFQEFQSSWEESNPWHEFTKACRAERQSMLGRL
jgi:c-di-GMP-related signal transduction protein